MRAESGRLVAADASPLIGLATAQAFEVLRALYGTLLVSRLVRDEVMAGGERPGAAELEAAMRAGWIRVAPTPMATWRLPELDAGEASTIALALEHRGHALVLMDDALGLERAAALDLETLDTAGLLLAAKRNDLVQRVAPLFERLTNEGFTIPEERRRAVCAEASES